MPTLIRRLTILLLLCCAGCAGYQIGTSLPDDIKTISVPSFRNNTDEPDLDRTVTQQTIREIQRDGTLSIANEGLGDITLKTTITDIKLSPVRYNRNYTRTVEEYRLTLKARIVVTRRKTGETMINSIVEGQATFVASGDLSSAKRTAIPDAAEDLAKEITNRIVEIW